MRTLILCKNSTIYTKAEVEFQCKQKGHTAYDYEIEIEAGVKLDEKDFLIDHTIIHKVIENVIQNDMGSCERLCLRVEERVKEKLKEHGVEVYKLRFIIKPVDSNAWIKLVADYRDRILATTDEEIAANDLKSVYSETSSNFED
jgi:hypothetical protein